jgi:hypothetical protein
MRKISFLILITILSILVLILLSDCASLRNASNREPPAPKITKFVFSSLPPAGYRQYQEMKSQIPPFCKFFIYFEFKGLTTQDIEGLECVWFILELTIEDPETGYKKTTEVVNTKIDTNMEYIKNGYCWIDMWSGRRIAEYEVTITLRDGFTGKSAVHRERMDVGTGIKC